MTGRLSSHPSCLLILDSIAIDPEKEEAEETKLCLQTLSSVIHVLVSISPHLRILITTRSPCFLVPPVASQEAPDDPAPAAPFETAVIEIGRL